MFLRLLQRLRALTTRPTTSSPEYWWGTSWEALQAALLLIARVVVMTMLGIAAVVGVIMGAVVLLGLGTAGLTAVALVLILLALATVIDD